MNRLPPKLRFSSDDLERAFDEWGANCGPGALAAVTGKTLEEVRPHLVDFEDKRYTNPTMMFGALHSLGICHGTLMPRDWPGLGLCRVQWEGPWTAPGVPIRARYRQTHWIGVCAANPDNIGVFDINAMANGSGWCSLNDWEETIVPWILEHCVPRASGAWHLTHSIDLVVTGDPA